MLVLMKIVNLQYIWLLENLQGDTYGDAHSPFYLASYRRFHMYLSSPNGQTTCARDTTHYNEVTIVRTEEVRVYKAIGPYQDLNTKHT